MNYDRPTLYMTVCIFSVVDGALYRELTATSIVFAVPFL
jgi:hypothetical protein